MPRLDRTGPAGMGPMTGWGRGRCTSCDRRSGRQAFGAGFGWGGRSRGWRHWTGGYGPPRWGRGGFTSFQEPFYEDFYTKDEEMVMLKQDAARLKKELDGIEQRLRDLEAQRQDEG